VKNVLIVDDEQNLLLSLKDGLSHHKDSFQIITAHNGREAVVVLLSSSIDLLVTDLKMPEMDGFALLAWVGSNRPKLPIIVMSAFGTPQLEAQIEKTGTLQFLDKPLNLATLEEGILNGLNNEHKSLIHGITLAAFLQLIKLEHKTCTLDITASGRSACLYLRGGKLIDARTDGLEGLPAALDIVSWDDAEIVMDAICWRQDDVIKLPMENLLLESFRLKDTAAEYGKVNRAKTIITGVPKKNLPQPIVRGENIAAMTQGNLTNKSSSTSGRIAEISDPKNTSDWKINIMAKGGRIMQEALEMLKKIKGFVAAGAFSAHGELLAEVSISADLHLAKVGALANDILLKAQEETDIMGVGRGSLIHIVAPKANLLMRCLNENTDFHASEAGRAHVHLLVVLEADGNVALAKMQLEKVILQIANEIR